MAYDPPDALACTLAWLAAHPDLPPALRVGGKARVSSRDLGVYPCLRVRLTPAGSGGIRWQVGSELQFELLDTLEKPKQIGDAEQLRLLQACLWLMDELPDAPQPLPGRGEVVTDVAAGVAPSLVTDPGVPTQSRWVATVTVAAHPAPSAQTQED